MARQSRDRNQAVGRLFEYDNYRDFLKDYFEEEKRLRPSFSQRGFALKAGFKSSGFCSLILGGSRKLGDAAIPKLVDAIGLVGTAAEFFESLVRYNQAETLEARTTGLKELKRLRSASGRVKVAAHQFPFWEDWRHVAIRELAVHADWRDDPARLGAFMRPRISGEAARRSLEKLVSLGLLSRSPDGKWQHSEPFLSGADTPPALLREFKREMTLRALEAMDSLPPSKRHFSTSTFSVSQATYRAICDKIDRLRAEILEMAESDTPEIVLQANFQIFPLSGSLSETGS